MKKLILSVLMLGVMMMTVMGVVSSVEREAPTEDTIYSWADCDVPSYGLLQVSSDSYERLGIQNGDNFLPCPRMPHDQTGVDWNPSQIIPGQSFVLDVIAWNTGWDDEHLKIWVDWNQDGDFDDSNELIVDDDLGSWNGYIYPTYIIETPINAVEGTTYLRAALRWVGEPTPSGSWTWGDVEDYEMKIQENPCKINFITPEEGSYTNEKEIEIEWEISEECNYLQHSLYYKEGSCDFEPEGWKYIMKTEDRSETSYSWDISGLEDNEYCLRLSDENSNEMGVSGVFTVDRTAPTIEFIDAPYFSQVSEETDEKVSVLDDSGIDEWELDFGDETPSDEGSSGGIIQIEHTYEEAKKYTITLTATDNAGNIATETAIIVVAEEEPDWIIPLYADRMNLISIPLVPEDTDYQEVLNGVKDNLDRIWVYQFYETKTIKENRWYVHYRDDGDWKGSSTFDDIVPGYGYIIFMDEDDVLYGNAKTILGDPEDEPIIPSEIHLANGYNLIGHFGTTPKNVWNALSSLTSLYGAPYWHKVLDVNEVEVTGDLESGQGYWLSMKHLPDTVTEDYYTYYP